MPLSRSSHGSRPLPLLVLACSALLIAAFPSAHAGVPVPTPQQLDWTETELAIMISYDMITQLPNEPNGQHFCLGAGGDENHFPVPPPSAFNPSNLSTDSWMEAGKALGAKYSVLVASHCSGFALWNTKINNYSIAFSPYKSGRGDIVAEYMVSSAKYDIKPGLYITWNYNYLYNVGIGKVYPGPLAPGQIGITIDDFHKLAFAQQMELWTQYQGQLYELWFDGGESYPPINAAVRQLQPQAIYLAGSADTNNARLGGQESGFLPYPIWSTTDGSGSGSPTGSTFCPCESDTPILNNDLWFWKPQSSLRPLSELKFVPEERATYVSSVGANANLLLGIMPDNTGSIPQDQMDSLQQLGDWIRRCYSPAAYVGNTSGVAASLTLKLDHTIIVDKLILQEDQSQGARVIAYEIELLPPGGYTTQWISGGVGQAVGNKRIHFLSNGPIPVQSLRVTATQMAPGFSTVAWKTFAALSPCD